MSHSLSIEIKEQDEEQIERIIRCKNCEHEITKAQFAVEPHEHTFRNPGGYSFHVLCYSHAPGAANVGNPTAQDSWFKGYVWTFAICAACNNHIGWWFSGTEQFAGLIATRLLR